MSRTELIQGISGNAHNSLHQLSFILESSPAWFQLKLLHPADPGRIMALGAPGGAVNYVSGNGCTIIDCIRLRRWSFFSNDGMVILFF